MQQKRKRNLTSRGRLWGSGAASCLIVIFALVIPGCDAIRRAPGGEAGTSNVEVAIFEGGYGIEWHRAMARRYTESRVDEGLAINLWGDPRVVEKVKPRILRGNPPDLLLTKDLPVWLMISAGKLLPFDAALDGPAPGSDTPWRDLFVPGTLDAYTSDGHVYAVPSAFGAWACWYDAALFEEHGWETPKTWGEFERLCAKVHAAGIAPMTFQGKYPVYAWWTFVTLIQRCGGLAAINRINALEAGAFSHPDVVWAARLLQRMGTEYFQPGALAMTHTESQLEWLNHKAAMILCGLWLPNEMKAATPPAFDMRCFNFPAVEQGKGNPALFNGEGTEFLFVPTDARHPETALDFARFLVSPANAPSMGAAIGVLSPLRGGTPRESVAPPLQSALDMIESAEGIFSIRLLGLLLTWRSQVLEPAFSDLLRGGITPEVCCARLDAGVAEAKADPNVRIPPHAPYDPTKYGESR